MTPAQYQALVISKALKLYAQHGIRVNRAYTPKNMMTTAARLTGQTFSPRDYMAAAAALETLAKERPQ